ncbi:hypothetical protein FB45DRAFT_864814 [Roridomyces roridus]|uniref:Uncharacterized protein n=1 Tax=Roridomyces roridus TaxID=1738132 RepID=A0AAD7C240_9AGAR|nr:hypothetical protein FB45DRAFT_864814 [Roridomyces roridus]
MDYYDYLCGPPYYTDVEVKEIVKEREKAIRNVYANWFTDPLLTGDQHGPFEWFTEWKDFDLIPFWLDRTDDGQLKIDKLFREIWVVPGTIEMLAFLPSCDGLYFLFAAGREYYLWEYYDERILKRHSKKFASHQEFVDYATKAEDWESNLPDMEVPQAVETDFKWW